MRHSNSNHTPTVTFEEASEAALRRMETVSLEEWDEAFRSLAELERSCIERDARSDAEAALIKARSSLNGHSANSH